ETCSESLELKLRTLRIKPRVQSLILRIGPSIRPPDVANLQILSCLNILACYFFPYPIKTCPKTAWKPVSGSEMNAEEREVLEFVPTLSSNTSDFVDSNASMRCL